MVHHVKDISPDQRHVIEALLGRALREDESVIIRPSHVLQDAPTGEDRIRAFRDYRSQLDQFAARVADMPESEIDAAIEEAIIYIRHTPE